MEGGREDKEKPGISWDIVRLEHAGKDGVSLMSVFVTVFNADIAVNKNGLNSIIINSA